jgi:hypothetical protein
MTSSQSATYPLGGTPTEVNVRNRILAPETRRAAFGRLR